MAVIENDEFHHVILPWPIEIELALRHSELVAFIERPLANRESSTLVASSVGYFTPPVLTGCRQRTWTFDCEAPLGPSQREFFARHLHELHERTLPHLNREIADDFERLACPESDAYLLDSPDFAATCINFVISGQEPVEGHPKRRSGACGHPVSKGLYDYWLCSFGDKRRAFSFPR